MMLRQDLQPDEVLSGTIRIAVVIGIPFVVLLIVRRFPWPRPFRVRFALMHAVAALALAAAWMLISRGLESLITTGRIAIPLYQWPEYMFLGGILYVFVAGPAYAAQATARAARAEAIIANTQLATLRAQLHPHFLFNALHTVVQLIPLEPMRAAEAAEMVADLLRSSLEEKRDEVSLKDEWSFVSRYLTVEQIRFGERLTVHPSIPADLLDERVPSFALQTLVENAVRHGASLRVAPTEIFVTATGRAKEMTLAVRNTGDASSATAGGGVGTGLARLRERLSVLYGDAARLTAVALDDGGYEAVLVLPRATMS